MYKLTSSNFITFVNAYPEYLNGKNRHFVAAAFIAKMLGVKVAQVSISSEFFSCKARRVGQSPLPVWLVNFMQKDGLFQCPNALSAKVPVDDTISSKELAVLETEAKELVLPNIA